MLAASGHTRRSVQSASPVRFVLSFPTLPDAEFGRGGKPLITADYRAGVDGVCDL